MELIRREIAATTDAPRRERGARGERHVSNACLTVRIDALRQTQFITTAGDQSTLTRLAARAAIECVAGDSERLGTLEAFFAALATLANKLPENGSTVGPVISAGEVGRDAVSVTICDRD
jgi:hypothetical protein